MTDVILTLTTIPDRLISIYNYDMRYCIDSLLNQSYTGEYEIHLNIPRIYSKTGKEYIIPEWLEDIKDPRLKVFRTEDYGSITKLIPTLERVTNKDAIIIVVDDDMIYHEELINEQIKNRNKWPDYAVGYDGIGSVNVDGSRGDTFCDNRDHFFSATGKNSLVNVLQHYKSVSYVRSFFEDDFFKFIEEHGVWCDDTSVAAYFAKNKRGRLVTYFEGDELFEDYESYLANLPRTFPVVKYTEHGVDEGCNLDRRENTEEFSEKHHLLFVNFIYSSYDNGNWVV